MRQIETIPGVTTGDIAHIPCEMVYAEPWKILLPVLLVWKWLQGPPCS